MDALAHNGHDFEDEATAVTRSVRPFRAGDEAELQRLFEGGAPAGERTFADWRWSSAGNPGGLRSWLACDEQGVTAHFATLPHRVRFDGGERTFAEVVDPLPAPDPEQGGPGPLEEVARRMLGETCTPGDDFIVYAWPDEAEWDRARLQLEFELVRTQAVLVREVAQEARAAAPQVELITRFDEQALWLFDRCAGRFGVAVIRDAAYLNWRFFEHPRHVYTALGVRDGEGILRGYAVTRHVDQAGARSLNVVDWLVPPDELEVGELLREAILARACAVRAQTVRLIVPEWSPWFASFQTWGWLVLPSDQLLVCRSAVSRYDTQWLRDAWWYQWADCHLA